MGYIYLRTNKINGKQYVGQVITKNFKKRQKEWNNLNIPYAGEAINNARKKYGLDAFDFEILKECEDKELDYWETYYIKELNTKAPYGYNLTDGGEGCSGYSPSEEHKRKLSEALKGMKLSDETKRKMSEARKGKHRTEETKRKISEAKKGKHLTEETKRKMSEARKGKHLTEETRKKLSKIRKGMKHTEEAKHKIGEANKGKHLTEEHKRKMSKSRINGKKSKPVLQLDKTTGEVIREWPSLAEVQRQLGYANANISKCCNEKRPFAYNYKWKYAV